MSQCSKVGSESKILSSVQNRSELYVGIDVHKRSYAVALVDKHKSPVHEFSMPASVDALVSLLAPIRKHISLCVYEAGPTGYALARALRANDLPAQVVSPGSIPRCQTQDSKTDQIDARSLATLAASGLLGYVAVPSPRQDAHRQLLRHRAKARAELTRVKNRIKMFLLYNGIDEPEGLLNWSRAALARLETMPLDQEVRMLLDMLIESYRFCAGHLARYQGLVRRLAKNEDYAERIERLRGIGGVGLLTAMTFMVEVHGAERFGEPEQVAKYAGLSPRLHQSGEGSRSVGLTHTGNRHLRHVLIEAAWRWKGRDEHARRHYLRIKKRTGCAQKAIAAVARKLAIVMWRMLVDGTPYIPGAHRVPARPGPGRVRCMASA